MGKATISLMAISKFLKSFSLSPEDERWLAYELLDNADKREEIEKHYVSKEEIIFGIETGLKDLKNGKVRPIIELIKELDYGK